MGDFHGPTMSSSLTNSVCFLHPVFLKILLRWVLAVSLADVDSGGTPTEVAVVQQCLGQLQFRRGQAANISQPSVGERNFRTKGRVGTVFG